jgi:pullulanase
MNYCTSLKGDLAGQYYIYAITLFENGQEITNWVVDPYSTASAPNSAKSYIYDEAAVNLAVKAWDKDKYVTLKNNVDAVIYELHVRDYTIDKSSGIAEVNKGKFLGLTQTNSKSPDNLVTGLANIKELGITHVQLLPVYDYGTGDETSMNNAYPWYNWGYDPVLYNNVEGSYASNTVGTARQEELKTLIATLHQNNIGVIKDVVFNHTFQTGNDTFSIFDKIVPFYFYRVADDGLYSNGSFCGNEVATEKPMVRKFIVDSIKHDVRNYHFDGFRFDLMGLIDTTTMLAIKQAVKKINPNALLIGEGWHMPSSYPSAELFTQANVQATGIAAFSDGMRDNLRGDVFKSDGAGFVQGAAPYNGIERLKQLIKGLVTGRDSAPITVFSPNETVNYVSVHDNATLMDKISSGAPNASDAERIQMNALAFGIIATSQGILLLDEGQKFGRTKHGNENSYATNDPTINPIQWGLKQTNQQLFEFYRGMIALRKSHPAFRMTDSAMIESDLHFLLATDHQIIYQIKAHANNDKWGTIMVVLNASPTVLTSKLGAGQWYLAVNGLQTYPSSEAQVNHTITIKPFSMAVLYQK